MSQPKSPPVAIIGMGCLFPKASDLQEYWANIKNKVDGLSEVPASHWSASDYFDEDPKRPDLTYARRGGVSVSGRLRPGRVRGRPLGFGGDGQRPAPGLSRGAESAQGRGLRARARL